MADISFRDAGPQDLELLRYWDTQPHVIASDPNDDWCWETELHRTPIWREQLVALLNDKPLGFLQIIDPALEDSHYWGDIESGYRAIDIWIGEAENLGKGYGTQIMRLALERCFLAADVKAVLIDPLSSNKKAHRFYERQGFSFVEEREFGEDQCHVYKIGRDVFTANSP